MAIRINKHLLWVLALLAGAASATPQGDEIAAIRARRLAYNQAIADRRADALPGFVVPGFVEVTSGGGITIGADKVRGSYAAVEFRDPAFITYERHTQSIAISANGSVAVERGRWIARYRTATTTEARASGLYQAGWVKQDGVWRVRTEIYGKLR